MNNFDGNRNLTHQVAFELGQAIVQGQYTEGGDFPTEAQMCESYQISRSVIREAVKMLTAKGLISSRPRQGIRVLPASGWNLFDTDVLQWIMSTRPSTQLLREFTELRAGVEPEAAALAARRQNRSAIDDIGRALERLGRASVSEDPLAADVDFHTAILLASDNRFFIQLRSFIETALSASIASTNRLKGVPAGDFYDHKKIFDAIVIGDAAGAERAMRSLLTEASDLLSGSGYAAPQPVPAGLVAHP